MDSIVTTSGFREPKDEIVMTFLASAPNSSVETNMSGMLFLGCSAHPINVPYKKRRNQ